MIVEVEKCDIFATRTDEDRFCYIRLYTWMQCNIEYIKYI
jgi:hypothetical protein